MINRNTIDFLLIIAVILLLLKIINVEHRVVTPTQEQLYKQWESNVHDTKNS